LRRFLDVSLKISLKIIFRKKCIGRLRKRLADYAFLTGYFEGALSSYHSAIELLKSTQDMLWLAGFFKVFIKFFYIFKPLRKVGVVQQ